MSLTVDDPRHGTTNAYDNYACRCQPCRDAKAAYIRSYRRTSRGSAAVRVASKAETIALKLFKAECPDLWGDILDQAWLEVTGHPKRSAGRPRNAPADRATP